jgi:FkbM family methyltransferase
MYLHSKNGKGYKIVLLNRENIQDYMDVPFYFDELKPAHQADYVRVFVLEKTGGIWMDSDTLVLDKMDLMFDLLEQKNGFFFTQGTTHIWNGVFGTRPNTPLFQEWKQYILHTLEQTPNKSELNWEMIGNTFLTNAYNKTPVLYQEYEILNGSMSVYPVNWMNCVNVYLKSPYDTYKDIIRSFQPFLVLVNSVYKEMESESIQDIFQKERPLKYFLEKGIKNAPLKNIDFLEIGTSNFDTLIQDASDTTVGISVEPLSHYLNQLPNKPHVQKIHAAITHMPNTSSIDIYYIPETTIINNHLPSWLKGCNTIGTYHPLHLKHNLQSYVQIEKVPLISISNLLNEHQIQHIQYLKIDTEGHDCVILKGLFDHIRYLPTSFYPSRITFESNEHTSYDNVSYIIHIFESIGYSLMSRGYDTTLEFKDKDKEIV